MVWGLKNSKKYSLYQIAFSINIIIFLTEIDKYYIKRML